MNLLNFKTLSPMYLPCNVLLRVEALDLARHTWEVSAAPESYTMLS